MKKLKMLLLCALSGCLDAPRHEPTVSTDEQPICTIADQAAGTCPGQEGCVPLDSCVDANMQDGSCCIRYGHPKAITTYSVTCNNDPGTTPSCTRRNTYDFGLVAIQCTTVTYWVTGPDGNVRQQSYTDCYII
jgi:hypothetical protein